MTEFRKSRSLNSPVGALSDVQLFAFFHFNDFLNIVSNHFQCKMENCRLEIEIPFKNVGVFFRTHEQIHLKQLTESFIALSFRFSSLNRIDIHEVQVKVIEII